MNSIRIFNGHPGSRIDQKRTRKLIACVLRGEGCRDSLMNVVFTGDRDIVRLNRKYLHHGYPTDVISFPLGEEGSPLVEGEVYVNIDQARRQAEEEGVTESSERARLVIHGVLHLLGYRDSTRRQKDAMTKMENHYLRKP